MKLRTILAILILSGFSLARSASPDSLDLAVTASDGHRISLSDYRGKWVLVNYWATWCGECIAELPALSKLAQEEPNLVVLGLTDEKITAQKLQTFLVAHPVSFPMAIIAKDAVPKELPASAFGLQMRPISYLIGPDGKVVDRFLGGIDTEKLKRHIQDRRR